MISISPQNFFTPHDFSNLNQLNLLPARDHEI